MSRRLVTPRENAALRQAADAHGLKVVIDSGWPGLEGPTLWIAEGFTLPWELVEPGFRFVERWDAAAPLWRYGLLARDVGTMSERERTRAVIRDLRVPLYAPEILFLQPSDGARGLLAAWREEMGGSTEPKLAFLRALYSVKPRFLALPRGWLKEAAPAPEEPELQTTRRLVRVQLAPGRYTKCLPEHAEMYRQRYRQALRRG